MTNRHRPSTTGLMAGAWVVLAGSLIVLVVAVVLYVSGQRFQAAAATTGGTVVEIVRQPRTASNNRIEDLYAAAFEFTLPDGRRQRAVSSYVGNSPCCSVGQAVTVRYDPQRPDRAEIVDFWSSGGTAIAAGGAGLAGMLGGLFALLKARRLGRIEQQHGWQALPLAGVQSRWGSGRTEWVIGAEWTDPRSGATRIFESHPLLFDPTPQLQGVTTLDVLFDPDQPDGPYEVHTGFLRDTTPSDD